VLLACLLAGLACARRDIPEDYAHITPLAPGTASATSAPAGVAATATAAPTRVPGTPPTAAAPSVTPRPTQNTAFTPTPDATRPSVIDRTVVEHYLVQSGDTLGQIGARYGVSPVQVAAANKINVNAMLVVGQVLIIPLPDSQNLGPDFKILPDSEFVYGPSAGSFDLAAFVASQRGYLASFVEQEPGSALDGRADVTPMTGADIVLLTARRYSVNPRLLLALLDYQSGWVSNPKPSDATLVYPLGRVEAGREGLLRQLDWAADQLNLGYYSWRAGSLAAFTFPSGELRVIARGLNAGTVGVQHFFALELGAAAWDQAVAPTGFSRAYRNLFGNPFQLAVEPLVPPDLVQPAMQLPFEDGTVWAFSGGPHGGWGSGSAWAALDFAPPAQALGCTPSDEWVVASAPGLVVRSEYGAVLEDLDGDGNEGTGWVVLYMHVESRDRVAAGTWLKTGDRIGHPSCEGGVANGTHVHLARKYNGEWIAADGALPFVLDGWVSTGLGKEYDGELVKGDKSIEACDCRSPSNEISRP
jgi:LasA protease